TSPSALRLGGVLTRIPTEIGPCGLGERGAPQLRIGVLRWYPEASQGQRRQLCEHRCGRRSTAGFGFGFLDDHEDRYVGALDATDESRRVVVLAILVEISVFGIGRLLLG